MNEETNEALQSLRDIVIDGFGYGSGIPLPIQSYLRAVTKAIVLVMEEVLEALDDE